MDSSYNFSKIKGIKYSSSFRFKPGQLIVDRFGSVLLVIEANSLYRLKVKIIRRGSEFLAAKRNLRNRVWVLDDNEVLFHISDAYNRVQGKFWKVLVGN